MPYFPGPTKLEMIQLRAVQTTESAPTSAGTDVPGPKLTAKIASAITFQGFYLGGLFLLPSL